MDASLSHPYKDPTSLPCTTIFTTKRLRTQPINPFDALPDELLLSILDRLGSDSLSKKSFSLVCKSFHTAESCHRRSLRPLRPDLLPAALSRYPSVSHLDLSLCPRAPDSTLSAAAAALGSSLLSIDLSRSKAFSHLGLNNLVSKCESLVEINLSNGTELDDRAAAAIGRARNLERLWLARCKMMTDIGLGCIAVGCTKLRLLCLKWCVGVTDLGVGLVAVKCREIRSLDLSYMQITKECLPAFLQLQYLEDLSLVGCIGIVDECLTSFKEGCKSLQVLNMSNCQHMSHAGLSSIINGSINLRQLILSYCSSVTDSLAGSIQGLSKLQSIILDGCQISSSVLKTIGTFCISLKELSLSKCSGVTDDGLSFIVTGHKDLLKLDITCCRNITDASLASITNSCTSLVSLRMESCNLVSKEGFILIGKHCCLLEELDLTDNELDDEGLKAISRCYKLSSLKIGICVNISDESLLHVGKSCSNLRELDLYRSVKITDSGIMAIASGCRRLQIINLAYCTEITDNSLRSLSKCSELNTLEIRGCPQVSSAGLLAVSVGCKQISKLDVKKCYDIDDSAMLPLACLSQNLRQINLSYCSVTDVGLLALASISCLQSMTILHLRGLTPNGLAAALLACGSLTKVKLHSSFKSLISQSFLEYMEARGCLFQWRDKPFQVQVEANEIWKQQSQGILVV